MDVVLVQNGVAHEIFASGAITAMATRFAAGIIDQMVEVVEGTVKPGDVWNGDRFVPPPPAVEPVEINPSPSLVAPESVAPAPVDPRQLIDAELARRLAMGVTYDAGDGSRIFDCDDAAVVGIGSYLGMASSALAEQVPRNNFLWHGGSSPFVWYAKDDEPQQMDVQDFVDFSRVVALHRTKLLERAIALKGMSPIPTSYADDTWWT